MMRKPPLLRLIGADELSAVQRMSCRELATRYVRLTRSMRRFEWLQRQGVRWADGMLKRRRWRLHGVWRELMKRFAPLFRQVLVASSCPTSQLHDPRLSCLIDIQTRLMNSRGKLCLPEILWQACVMGRNAPDHLLQRFHARFHLRALLDELPECDQRGVLRVMLFATAPESRERQGRPIESFYDEERRKAVAEGLLQFAKHLHAKRSRLERLTSGAICAGHCESVAAAYGFLCDVLLDESGNGDE